MESPTPSLSCQIYGAYIRSCWEHSPASKFYLQQLERYVKSATESKSNEIICLEINPELGGSSGSSKPPKQVPFNSTQAGARLAIVGGFPSPGAIGELGAMYNVRPEIFLGHLVIGQNIIRTPNTSVEKR